MEEKPAVVNAQDGEEADAEVEGELEAVPVEQPVNKKPIYEVDQQLGHYGACLRLTQDKKGANPDVYTGVWNNITQGLANPYRGVLATYWMASLKNIEHAEHNYKEHQLPLARIKKVMKTDPEVKMISAEAPILFAKGCDIFITELTMRAWIHAEENKRRTLQRSDIAAALSKSDMFDFLIDVVSREEANTSSNKRSGQQAAQTPATSQAQASMPPPQTHHMAHPQDPQQPPHGYGHYAPPEHDPYRHPHSMYPDPGYAPHGQAQMGFDPSQAMYGNYLPPSQMYMQMPPRQEHAPPPQPPQHYQPYDARHTGGDAEGETEDVG